FFFRTWNILVSFLSLCPVGPGIFSQYQAIAKTSTSLRQASLHNLIYFLSQIDYLPSSSLYLRKPPRMLRQSACSDTQQVALPIRLMQRQSMHNRKP
ncbi:uncharacterized protein PpBr36_09155, partial [Pyricularia pennisetigena]|uniref:uncharacterized protein n=1 Tax=Pyricularia pennisetigena TaxID=1578925 RepID=UPI00114F6FBB